MGPRSAIKAKASLAEKDPSACRIETQGGTVYWLSQADGQSLRWVIREQLQRSDTNTQVVCPGAGPNGVVELGDKFRGRLRSAVETGKPFVLEVVSRGARVMSEPVVGLEVGTLPEMIFR